MENIETRLRGELEKYTLPNAITDEELAIRTSLSFLELANKKITMPLWFYAYLAPMTTLLRPMPSAVLYIYGITGTRKTSLAQAALCHFGDFSDGSQLPNFRDTTNKIERRAFILKDSLMILDDYHPSAHRFDASAMEKTAQQIIRATGNRTGRGRLNADSSEKGMYEPRCMLIITGEEVVSMQSTLARILLVEVEPGAVDLAKLSVIQRQYPLLREAMLSYLLWMRNAIPDIQAEFKNTFQSLRQQYFTTGMHGRLVEQMAFLMFAGKVVSQWLIEKGIWSPEAAIETMLEFEGVMNEILSRQSLRIQAEDPVLKFFEVLDALIIQGKVYLFHKVGSGGIKGDMDKGELIGWYDEDYYYLLYKPMWHALQSYHIREGSHYPFSERTLADMLDKRGCIQKREQGHTSVVKIRGEAKRVLIVRRPVAEEMPAEAQDDE